MAKMVTIEYVDDLDGASIDADSVDTVEFSCRGTTYSLMLSADNGTQFDRDMARYIQAAQKAAAVEAREARKAGRRGRDPVARNFEIVPIDSTEPEAQRSATPKTRARAAVKNTSLREWARANGHNVSPRGRLA